MSDTTPSRRDIAASDHIRSKPVVRIISGVLSVIVGTLVGLGVWAAASAFGVDAPAWIISVFGIGMLAWYVASLKARRDGGMSTKIEDTVLSGASKVVDPAKAMAALLDGVGDAPAMSKQMLRKAGHMVTRLPQDGVELDMVVTRQQQAAVLVGISLGGATANDAELVRRLASLCEELAAASWDLGVIAVASDLRSKAPIKVGAVVVCSPAQVLKALVHIPKMSH